MGERVQIMPRALTRDQVAAYLGLSPSAVADWQARGLIPGPIPGTHRWDRLALDDALDQASGRKKASEATALDQWRQRRAGAPERH